MENCAPKVGVYYPNQPSRTTPSFWLERAKAREEVNEGRAAWIDSARSIRLIRINISVRDESCRMGPNVVEDCWTGKRRARAIAESWRNGASIEMDNTTEITSEITPVEYARACGLTLGYVYALIWAGRLPARKMLGRWLIPGTELDEKQTRCSRVHEKEPQQL